MKKIYLPSRLCILLLTVVFIISGAEAQSISKHSLFLESKIYDKPEITENIGTYAIDQRTINLKVGKLLSRYFDIVEKNDVYTLALKITVLYGKSEQNDDLRKSLQRLNVAKTESEKIVIEFSSKDGWKIRREISSTSEVYAFLDKMTAEFAAAHGIIGKSAEKNNQIQPTNNPSENTMTTATEEENPADGEKIIKQWYQILDKNSFRLKKSKRPTKK